MTKPSDWLVWAGGDCPVALNAVVEVKMRGPGVMPSRYFVHIAERCDWQHRQGGDVFDVVAYRVLAPQIDDSIATGPVDLALALSDWPGSPGRNLI